MASRIQVGAVAAAVGLLMAGCAGSTVERRELAATSPLAEFLGIPPRNQLGLPHLDVQERQRQDEITELVARCMTEAGFEYQVVPMADRLGQEFLDAYLLAPAEFAQRYGYGATTLAVEPYTDPNQELRDALSADRQSAYDLALWGDSSQVGGCYQQASTEVYGGSARRQIELARFDQLLTDINQLYQRIDADPRIQEAHQRWAGCLAEAGYPGFTTPPQARQSVFDRLAAPAADDDQRLAEAREYELALAPVDHACQQRHLAGPRRAVTLEQELAFLDARRTDLEQYRDWLTG